VSGTLQAFIGRPTTPQQTDRKTGIKKVALGPKRIDK
jgi:hypothetical protein